MVARMSFPVLKWVFAALVVALASLLAPSGYAMQVAPIEPVVWDTADGGNGHTYLFVPLPYTTSWSAANAKADTITLPDGSEGYLATIGSPEERAFIRDAVLPYDWANPVSAVWIAPENQYMLVNGEEPVSPPGSNHWQPFKSNVWQWVAHSEVSPEDWNYGKWRGENESDDDDSIHKRFLTHWMGNHHHGGHGHFPNDGCGDGHPELPTPKILGMIVEFDPADVPEPVTGLLSALGISLLGLYRRRC